MSGNKNSGYDHNCRWITADGYCEKKVGWKMVTEDDGEKYRYYETFCKEHLAKFLEGEDD